MVKKNVKDMTFGEAWSERAELARGPGKNRRTKRFKELDAHISELYRKEKAGELQDQHQAE